LDEVVFVERDRLPAAPVPRRRGPQSQGPRCHNQMAAAQYKLEALAPGFMTRQLGAGDARARVPTEARGTRRPARPRSAIIAPCSASTSK
jgi:hypothetical protein